MPDNKRKSNNNDHLKNKKSILLALTPEEHAAFSRAKESLGASTWKETVMKLINRAGI